MIVHAFFLMIVAGANMGSEARMNPTDDLPVAEIRNRYAIAATNEKVCKELYQQLKESSLRDQPLMKGYLGCVTMMMASHVVSPATKLSYFNEGKDLLEAAIAEKPGHIELRYLRYTVQTNLPSFLGYDEHKTADRAYLSQVLPAVRDKQLYGMIHSYLNSSPK